MENGKYTSAAHEVRFRNAVKIEILEECRDEDCAKLVMENVLLPCGVEGKDLLCMAEYRNQGVVEVVFREYGKYRSFKSEWEVRRDQPDLKSFRVEFLHRSPWKMVTVMVYNPYVTTGEVTEFLKVECEAVEFVKLISNSVGVWSGKRLYRCRFYVNDHADDHLEHISQTFQIGRNRGFLKYSGMPAYCWKCGERGHMTQDCDLLQRCRNCSGLGHTAEKCTVPKKCTHCQSTEHLYEDCPTRPKTFAETAAGGKKTKKTNLPEDEDVLRQVVEMEKEMKMQSGESSKGDTESVEPIEKMEGGGDVVQERKSDGTAELIEEEKEMECQTVKEARHQDDLIEEMGSKRRKVVNTAED